MARQQGEESSSLKKHFGYFRKYSSCFPAWFDLFAGGFAAFKEPGNDSAHTVHFNDVNRLSDVHLNGWKHFTFLFKWKVSSRAQHWCYWCYNLSSSQSKHLLQFHLKADCFAADINQKHWFFFKLCYFCWLLDLPASPQLPRLRSKPAFSQTPVGAVTPQPAVLASRLMKF